MLPSVDEKVERVTAFTVYSVYVVVFLLLFTADYCCLLIALSQLRSFIPIVIPIESIEAQPVVHIKAHLHHGPQRNELKNWAMRFSEQICQWASRVT